MKKYLLVEGSEIYDFPVVLFISDEGNIAVYSDEDSARNIYTRYVENDNVVSLEALADRFPYCECEIGEVDGDIEKIRLQLTR